MIKPFQFKQFAVNQDQCAMKIGTDAVLLGAWTKIDPAANSILDIGAGTGILALMMAQRSFAELIDALEIEDAAYEQCVDNFESSPWGDRLFCYHASLLEFTEEIEDSYDLIISNPPFYDTVTAKSETQHSSQKLETPRATARFTDAMPFEHLLYSVSQLLSENGQFSVIIPYSETESFITLAESFKLFPKDILYVRGTAEKDLKRSLINFTFKNQPVNTSELTIEIERHIYTPEYIVLTQDFYLNFPD